MSNTVCAKCGGFRDGSNAAYCRLCYNEYKRAWYQRNREQEVKRSQDYNDAHPAQHRRNQRNYWKSPGGMATMAAWKQNNPDAVKAHDYKKKAKRAAAMSASIGVTQAEWQRIKVESKGKCFYCGIEGKLTMDHKTPLCRGGKHEPSNIAPACSTCNCTKHALTESEFRAYMAGGDR